MRTIEFTMQRGISICEKGSPYRCLKPAIGEFKRIGCEAKEWPNKKMPISLCAECAGDRIPLTATELKVIEKLVLC